MKRFKQGRKFSIAVPLTSEEREVLVRLASEQGISLAQLVRELMGLRELLKRGFHGRSIIVPVAEVKQE